MSWFKALLALLPRLIDWIKSWGAAEERARQKRKADHLEEHFKELADNRPDLDTALERLRRKPDRRDVP